MSDSGKHDFFVRLIQFLDSSHMNINYKKKMWPRIETHYWMRETVDLILNYNYSYEKALATVKRRQIGKDYNGTMESHDSASPLYRLEEE